MITVLFGGGREQSNTATLTEQVLEGQDYRWINLEDVVVSSSSEQAEDDANGQKEYEQVTDQIFASEDVILVSPVCWYSISMTMQHFIEQWSEALEASQYENFKEKLSDINFRLILIGGDSPRVKALPCVQQVDYSLQFLGAHLQDYLIGCATQPGDIFKDTYAMNEAARWNEQYTASVATSAN
ncbi:NAD(P)H-dependent oxidoreductase [Staphylococcus microti]|uniref:NAD(P)H-dependent oxidoreductase n=1 Tax=Staphylococcus microti TaxID=569857 RepID=A0A0D6XSC3_9STAP|nr:NAD(P)H-dependent oxidoreductase [Staphylococcus microti]KIX90728.1 NAD(P)H-dependent oxidoreductase [Staphylococcus microti]PNZ81709.1 flavodoxin family protein [Staphylococcus microti]SUM56691.1 putative multimeric flavodoxin WrbA family protein [Staphylococcus microti]